MSKENIDHKVVKGFGEEWSTFNQSSVSREELNKIFNEYFSVFPWDELPDECVGFDLGCGSGRWGSFVAPRVGKLYCIDPSIDALNVAKTNIKSKNTEFINAGVDKIPLKDSSMDFGYSLGVLHHVPDTEAGIVSCVKKIKIGSPFLLYLYYSLDNRPKWFRIIWRCSNALRIIISRLPRFLKHFFSSVLAGLVYLPLARFAKHMEKRGKNVSNYPLSSYRNSSFYTMRTDSYDRFCTRLEKRYSRVQIQEMMEKAGLSDIKFREEAPFWCAVGFRIF
ncbi:MAG: class I SAM-dependent methyltransferase [Oscillospiraceae bacterium]|nr:class I SAM-dependent methyltransferase [Oscillospiraceae bacterium]